MPTRSFQVLEYEGEDSDEGDFGEDGEEYSVRTPSLAGLHF